MTYKFMKFLWVILLSSTMLSWQVAAGGLHAPDIEQSINPSIVQIAVKKCSRLIRQGGREIIANSCNVCRLVSITRKRPGNPAPVARSLTVQPRSTLKVPFYGPGASRITSEQACPGTAGDAPNLTDTRKPKQKISCVKIEQTNQGGILLFNSCKVCRAVAIERQTNTGRSMGREYYKVNPGYKTPVRRKNADQVALLADIPCP